MAVVEKERESFYWGRRQFLKLAAGVAAGAVVAATVSPVFAFPEMSTGTLQPKRRYSSDYVISIDEGQVNAANAAGEIKFSGMDAGMVIQSAINALTSGGEIFIRAGTYQPTSASRIQIGNKVTLIGEGPATVLKAPNNLNTDFIRNSDHTRGNSDIVIRDLTIDGNRANQSSQIGAFGVFMRRVNGLTVKNVRLTEAALFHLYTRNCDNVNISDTTIEGTGGAFQDGFHIESCRGVTINGLKVSTGDDALAINSDVESECRDIVASNLDLNTHSAGHGIHIYVSANKSTDVRNVSISNFVIHDCGLIGVYIAQLSGATGQIRDISFSNGQIVNPGEDGVRIAPAAGQSCTRINLSGLTIRSSGKRGINLLRGDNINISDVQIYDTADGWQSLYWESCSSVAVTGGHIDYVSGSKTNKLDCIHIDESSMCTVQGVTVENGGTGIRLTGSTNGSNGNIIDGNRVTGCRVGITIATAQCLNNIVRNNYLLNNATALNDSGTGTTKDNNMTA